MPTKVQRIREIAKLFKKIILLGACFSDEGLPSVADAVVHMRNGKYGLIEIKLGGKELIEKGAATLKKLAERIDTVKMSSPSFLMVLTATGDFAYRRDDGIVVCPIGCLKP